MPAHTARNDAASNIMVAAWDCQSDGPMDRRTERSSGPPVPRPYGFVVVFLSTLFPITPPRIAPAAPPITAPFTLSLLVAAPMIAPAAPPIAASRLVCFSTVVVGVLAVFELPLVEL